MLACGVAVGVEADWRDQAACLGQDELMFDVERVEEALDVCRACPVVMDCRDAVMADTYLRRAYAYVGAVVGGLPPAQLRKRRSDRKMPLPVSVRRCVYCGEPFTPRTGQSKLCSARCRNKRHLMQKKRWEQGRYAERKVLV